jgi:hypothetical protein
MKKIIRTSATALLALACLAALTVPAVAQDKPVDMKKVLADIIGDYDFSFQGESMVVQFTESDGKLFGAPVGEEPEELTVIEGNPSVSASPWRRTASTMNASSSATTRASSTSAS